jgi:hypothetical protein
MRNLGKMVLAGVMLASAATAQSYSTRQGDESYRYQRGYVSATTPVTDVSLATWKNSFFSTCKSGTAVSLTYLFKDNDGNTLNSQTVACDTSVRQVVSQTAPLYFTKFAISPTTAVSTTAGGVSLTNVEARAIQ